MAPDTESTTPASPPAMEAPAEQAPGEAAPAFKVELDIEDAPFLEELEKEEPAPGPAEEAGGEADPTDKAAGAKGLARLKATLAALLANKKRLALVGGAVVLVLLAPVAYLLFFAGPSAEAPPPVVEAVPETRQLEPPPRQEAPEGPKFMYKADKFLVECRGAEGEIRFLRCSFAIPTDNQQLFNELVVKNIAVRDAIHYYLINKPLTFLSDPAAQTGLKQDLISVINEHVTSAKVQELFIEEYLITGK